jgi:hypothetical protein
MIAVGGEGDAAELVECEDVGVCDLPGALGRGVDADLEVSSCQDNHAHLLQDSLDNAYQGSDVGRAFSPPFLADSLR